MKNIWKKSTAFAIAMSFASLTYAPKLNPHAITINTEAAETNTAAITVDTEADESSILITDGSEATDTASSKEEVDESYYDEDTFTLHLKGYIKNSEDCSGIILPEGVNKWEIQNIVAEEGTVFPQDCSYLFCNLSHISLFDLKKADTSNVTNMSGMFWGIGSDNLDLSAFDTSNVTDMSEMFMFAFVPSINLSSFNTSKVTNMEGMFSYIINSTLDISNFDTSNVTLMTNMFFGSINLETIYVGDKWSVENINGDSDLDMFSDCTCLSGGKGTVYDPLITNSEYARIDCGEEAPGYLSAVGDKQDLSYFDEETSTLHLKGLVKNNLYTEGMIIPDGLNKEDILHIKADEGTILPANSAALFIEMANLETADLKNAVTSTVVDMSNMFYGCENLVSVDLSSFDTSKVQDMRSMFAFCSKLESLDLSSFDTSCVTNMLGMFEYCSSLTSLDLSNFDTCNVSDMGFMFMGCTNLGSITLCNFTTGAVSYFDYMFADCENIKSLDLSNFDTSNVLFMSGMFSGCTSLSNVDLSSFNTSNVAYMDSMFKGCNSLETLDLSKFDTSKVEFIDSMFEECSSLKTIYVGNKWVTLNIDKSMGGALDLFKGCYNLTGSRGTVYDPNNTSIEYAHIDGGKLFPGYFTAEPNIIENTVKDATSIVKKLLGKYKLFKKF